MPKNGQDHLESLRDGRDVYIYGKKVEDVTTDPSFRNSVDSFARLYDYQCEPENLEVMTFESPDSGERVNRCWQLPTCYEEMVQRREAISGWAELHYGFLGRSPDHVASSLSGMYMGLEVFEQHDRRCGAALRDYYRYARDNDLFLTYVIINPQVARSKNPSEQDDESAIARICDEDSEGITIKGAKMLGTSSIMANEVMVTSLQPLKEDEKDYAFSCVLPMNAKGVKVLSRKSYEYTAGSVFDNPLASRFDENDAVIYFDEVKVPWDRVLVYRDAAMCLNQFHGTPAHISQNYQSQVRLEVKLRFLVGLARKIADAIGTTNIPSVRETLGQLAAEADSVKAFVRGMEVEGTQRGPYYLPNRHLLYTAQVLTQQLYPKIVQTLRELAGGAIIMLPSGIEDLRNDETGDLVLRSQCSPTFSAEDRVKLFKMAWDATGSEFASRHIQYEMFYAGASFVTRSHSFRTYDWEGANLLVDKALNSYSLEAEVKN